MVFIKLIKDELDIINLNKNYNPIVILEAIKLQCWILKINRPKKLDQPSYSLSK